MERNVQGTTITFIYGNGETRSVDVATLPEDMKFKLMMHGAGQKFGDTAAGKSDVEAIAGFDQVLAALQTSNWTTRSAGGDLIEALARVTGKPIEDCAVAVAKLDADARKALRKDARLRAVLATMKAERLNANAPDDDEGDTLTGLFG